MNAVSRVCTALAAAALCTLPATAMAQTDKYPTKSVRMLVPFAPGGGTDITARLIAQKMSEVLGQQVIVDNRAGGGGTIGAETAVRAAPDGYTVIMVSGSYGTNAALYNLPYDPVKDIQALVMIGESGFVLALHPSVPAKSVPEFIAHAKANPGKLNYASTGTGGITHLTTELFDLMAGTKMTHIPYKGTGPALTDLIAGQVDLMFGNLPEFLPQIRGGKLKAYGTTYFERAALAPDIPTIAEQGYPGFYTDSWYGIVAPASMPKEVVARMNAEVSRALALPEVRDALLKRGLDPIPSSPERFGEFIRSEIAKYAKIVKDAGIKID